ncbi:unnamed protein product [Arctia plantaginis]|uniref:PiggyBac transposable element-derived protein 4 C-terminal zinc-ribbon domain-containing protein n=1 Tax=Arctia plantaginis TaxID=874455 RepID=A0A8S1B6L2_ARCPL|nr:unnamed protein product [Arctia plantaginis]
MADDLIKPWLRERFQTVTLPRNLKQSISEILKIDDHLEGTSQEVHRTRKTCSYCPAKKRRMTTTFCKVCKKAICREHIVAMCNHCSM